jgi:hypothetical protein
MLSDHANGNCNRGQSNCVGISLVGDRVLQIMSSLTECRQMGYNPSRSKDVTRSTKPFDLVRQHIAWYDFGMSAVEALRRTPYVLCRLRDWKTIWYKSRVGMGHWKQRSLGWSERHLRIDIFRGRMPSSSRTLHVAYSTLHRTVRGCVWSPKGFLDLQLDLPIINRPSFITEKWNLKYRAFNFVCNVRRIIEQD